MIIETSLMGICVKTSLFSGSYAVFNQVILEYPGQL